MYLNRGNGSIQIYHYTKNTESKLSIFISIYKIEYYRLLIGSLSAPNPGKLGNKLIPQIYCTVYDRFKALFIIR